MKKQILRIVIISLLIGGTIYFVRKRKISATKSGNNTNGKRKDDGGKPVPEAAIGEIQEIIDENKDVI